MISSKPSNLQSILFALLPVPPKHHFKSHANTTAVNKQQIHNPVVLRWAFNLILCPLNVLFNICNLMLSVDSWMSKRNSVISAWMADYFKNIHWHLIMLWYSAVID